MNYSHPLGIGDLAALFPSGPPPDLLGITLEFVLFTAKLLGIAAFHHHTLTVRIA